MVPNLQPSWNQIPATILAASTPDYLPCDPPTSLEPLFNLLNSITELAYIAGIFLGLIGFLSAALFILMPGEDWTRRGKQTGKSTFIGVVLLLSADMIVSFLVNELGGVVCS